LQKHSPLVNTVLYWICRLEMGVFSRNQIAGLTVFAVAERPS
jgi:hypothetical protein